MTRFLNPLRRLRSNASAAGAVEFALVAPLLFAMLVGIANLGLLFLANAGLRASVEDAARYATIWPRPDSTAITNRIASKRWGMQSSNIVGPTVNFNLASTPRYVDISMTYNITINYVFGRRTIALTETRRAYVTG